MFRYLLIYMACLLFAFSVKAQGISNDTIPKEVLMLDGKPMTEKQINNYIKTPYGPTKGSGGLSLADRLTRRKPPLA
jgi:hypothetical protein